MIHAILSRIMTLGDLSTITSSLPIGLQLEDNPIFKLIVPAVTIFGAIWALWNRGYPLLESFMVNAHIPQGEQLYDDLTRWMEHHTSFISFDARGESQSDRHGPRRLQKKLSITGMAGYRYRTAVSPPLTEYTSNVGIHLSPSKGSQFFWFNKTLMHLRLLPMGGPDAARAVSIHCMTRSTGPLRAFLEEVRTFSKKESTSYVTVYRISASRDSHHWTRVTSRPARDISTVILARDKKDTIIKDIKEYLSPRTRKWYSNHGVPYRRGYLLSGPPGTGKSSLAGAVAGMFDLDIYVLSLSDPDVTESQLIYLLSKVPSHSVVLVEDVDAASVTMSRSRTAPEVSQESGGGSDVRQSHAASDYISQPVSLSTLLNAIDGVASHEGRVLIMTTNHPETLDSALTRAGRVDLHLKFGLPGREEFRELFRSMYTGLEEFEEQKSPDRDIDRLSVRFADQLPANRFSVADLQGFLLQHKLNPEEACEKVAEWIEQFPVEKEKDTPGERGVTLNESADPLECRGPLTNERCSQELNEITNGFSGR